MNQHFRFTRRTTLLVASALVVGVTLSGAGCKRKPQGSTAVATAPRAAVPTADENRAAEIKQKRADLQDIPLLVDGVNYTDPTGEIWIRYPSGIMVHDLRRDDEEGPQIGQTV